jgi:hypothetical protein
LKNAKNRGVAKYFLTSTITEEIEQMEYCVLSDVVVVLVIYLGEATYRGSGPRINDDPVSR